MFPCWEVLRKGTASMKGNHGQTLGAILCRRYVGNRRRRLISRIDVAMTVLTESLQELGPSPQDVRDKKAILDGLRTLRLLQKELDVTTEKQDIASEQERTR